MFVLARYHQIYDWNYLKTFGLLVQINPIFSSLLIRRVCKIVISCCFAPWDKITLTINVINGKFGNLSKKRVWNNYIVSERMLDAGYREKVWKSCFCSTWESNSVVDISCIIKTYWRGNISLGKQERKQLLTANIDATKSYEVTK